MPRVQQHDQDDIWRGRDFRQLGSSEQSCTCAGSAPPLPAGLHFSVHVTTPIDIDKAAAGDPIEAVLTAPMHDKKKAVVAPTGALLHGRLRTVKVWMSAFNTVQIGMQFESIEIEGRSVPLNAIYLPVYPMSFGSPYGMRFRTDNSFIGGTFSFNGVHLHPKDLDSEWVTVGSQRAKRRKEQEVIADVTMARRGQI